MNFTTLKNFRKAFTNGLSEGIRVRAMNEENIDDFCEMMQGFFEHTDNDFWLNRLDSGIYQIEYGANSPVLRILVTPGLVRFRTPPGIEISNIDSEHQHIMSTGALGIFAFIGIFEGDVDFEHDFITQEESKEPKATKDVNDSESDKNDPWLL